jgi:hypothetical protein
MKPSFNHAFLRLPYLFLNSSDFELNTLGQAPQTRGPQTSYQIKKASKVSQKDNYYLVFTYENMIK